MLGILLRLWHHRYMPELHWAFGYPFARGLMLLISVSLYVVFKRQDDPRAYFTFGYNDHAWVWDEKYVTFAKNDGSNPLLFDVSEDPDIDRYIARERPDVAEDMWNDYVLADAGDPLPTY